MKLKLFTLNWHDATGSFDEEELQTFLAERELLAVQSHFFQQEGTPRWTILVTYRELNREAEAKARRADPNRDWRNEVAEADRPLYDALRSWRNERARHEGRPAYILLHNAHLAEIARRRPRSLTELQEIPGLGAAKAAAFGDAVLALVRQTPPAALPGPPADGH